MVVGNQNSGKSSLLEGLTGLSFPISNKICTRFATQVILRHAPDEFPHVKAVVFPGRRHNADISTGPILISSTAFLGRHAFDTEDFPRIIEKVK